MRHFLLSLTVLGLIPAVAAAGHSGWSGVERHRSASFRGDSGIHTSVHATHTARSTAAVRHRHSQIHSGRGSGLHISVGISSGRSDLRFRHSAVRHHPRVHHRPPVIVRHHYYQPRPRVYVPPPVVYCPPPVVYHAPRVYQPTRYTVTRGYYRYR